MAVNINLGLTADAAGTVDVITATYAPAVTALTDRLVLIFRATGANQSTTPNFSPNGLTAHTIVRHGGQALRAGDIPAARFEAIVMYDLANTRWELLNPALGNGDVFWKAGAGVNSLMDKRSTTGSGQEGFTAGFIAENSGDGGQAIGAGTINSGLNGQAVGNLANNSAESGQAFGKSANNSGDSGQAIGSGANNSGENGQAIGVDTTNTFARSTALGHLSATTADDQMNLAQTVRLQAYTGAGTRLLQIDNDGIVSGVTKMVAKMRRDAAQSINSSTHTKILLDAEEFDVGGIADLANSKFVISRAGKYLIVASAGFSLAGNTRMFVSIYKNGSAIRASITPASFSVTVGVPAVTILDLIINDEIEMYLWQNAASPGNTETGVNLRPEISIYEL